MKREINIEFCFERINGQGIKPHIEELLEVDGRKKAFKAIAQGYEKGTMSKEISGIIYSGYWSMKISKPQTDIERFVSLIEITKELVSDITGDQVKEGDVLLVQNDNPDFNKFSVVTAKSIAPDSFSVLENGLDLNWWFRKGSLESYAGTAKILGKVNF